jgi:hypothetical protein
VINESPSPAPSLNTRPDLILISIPNTEKQLRPNFNYYRALDGFDSHRLWILQIDEMTFAEEERIASLMQ